MKNTILIIEDDANTAALNDGVLPPSSQTFSMLQDETLRIVQLVEDVLQLAKADAAHDNMVAPGSGLPSSRSWWKPTKVVLMLSSRKTTCTYALSCHLPSIDLKSLRQITVISRSNLRINARKEHQRQNVKMRFCKLSSMVVLNSFQPSGFPNDR